MVDMNRRLAAMLADRAASGQSLFGNPVLNHVLGWKPIQQPKSGGEIAQQQFAKNDTERMQRLMDAIIWSDESIAPPQGSVPWSELGVPYPKNDRGNPPSAINPHRLQEGDLEWLKNYRPPPPRRR